MYAEEALVLLSGGLDSATCLAWAVTHYTKVKTITFFYGQRHSVELTAAEKVSKAFGVDNTVVAIPPNCFQDTVLTGQGQEKAVAGQVNPDGLPKTFVPARNLVFLALAAGLAYRKEGAASDLVIGANDVDYSGYPDCRPESILAAQIAIRCSLGVPGLSVQAPLLGLSKSEIVLLLIDTTPNWSSVLQMTVSCYNGVRHGCGECDSCKIRENAFRVLHMEDPAKG